MKIYIFKYISFTLNYLIIKIKNIFRYKNIHKKVSKESIKRKSNIIKFGLCKKQILGKVERGITIPCPDELIIKYN